MKVHVSGLIRFRRDDCPDRVWERLHGQLTFDNPAYQSRQRMGRYLGGTPSQISCLAARPDGWAEMPRGAVGLLRRVLSEEEITPEFVDERTLHAPAGLHSGIKARGYQEHAVGQMQGRTQGTVVMPCGGGKTVTGCHAIATVDQPSLIVVHTADLLAQWCASAQEFLGVKPGVIADGKREIGLVTVAMVQSLVRMPGTALCDLGRQFGCLIIDEAHHTPASTFQQVVAHMPAHYRFGLTATPEREDGLTRLLDLSLGPRLVEVTYGELVAAGHLQTPEVRPVHSRFTFDYQGPDDFSRCMSALIEDPDRNTLISGLVAQEARAGHSVLCLSGRVSHCRELARLVRDLGVEAEVLVGSVKKDKRREIVDRLRSGALRVVVASTLADEGLDVPRLDRIVLAYPGRTKGRTAQRLGRIMRPHPSKTSAVLFDVVDGAVRPLLRQFRERSRLYRQLAGGQTSWK